MITFSSAEKVAILAMNKAMVLADGVVDKNEVLLTTLIMTKLNVTQSEGSLADDMKMGDAIDIVKKMTSEKKRFVCGLLGTMMDIDNDVDPREQLLWALFTDACGFPTMSVAEAKVLVGDFFKS